MYAPLTFRVLTVLAVAAVSASPFSAVRGKAAAPPAPPLQVAITFDDLPAHGALPPGVTRLDVAHSILDTLHREHLPPVYGFINAVRVEESPDSVAVLDAWRAAGQPLGNHTFTHMDLDANTVEDFEANIAKNEPMLQKEAAAGPNADWHWFRYPYLHEGDTLEKHMAARSYLKQHGYKIAEVTMDFEDYLWSAPYARCLVKKDDAAVASLEASYLATADQYITVFRDVTHTLYGHDIPYVLLMHVGAFDARMLPQLLALLRSRGFQFTSLDAAERDPAYAVDPAIGYKGGGALQEMVAAQRKVKFPPNSKPYKELDAMCR